MSASEKAHEAEARLDRHFANDYHPPVPAAPDTWHDTGSMANGWGKGSGFFKYKLLLPGVVAVAAKDLTAGTLLDGTVICSAANGLNPNSYQPATNKRLVAYTDQARIAVGSNVEECALLFVNDGSIQCIGVGGAATTVSCYGLLFIDI